MNIVYLIGRFPPVYGGGGNVEIFRSKELVKRGHTVHFITPRYERSHPAFEVYEGIKVIRVFPPLRGPISELVYVLNFFIKVIGMDVKPDLIIDAIPYGNSMILTRLFSRLLKIPVIARLTQTGANEPLATKKGKFGFVRRKLYSTYDNTIAISPDLFENCKQAGIPLNRVTLIPICVDTDLFCPINHSDKSKLRSQLFPDVQGKIITIVGNVSSRKRSHLAIEAWKILKSAYDDYATLVFVGPIKSTGHPFDEVYVEKLREKIRQYGLENSVIFTGFQKNVHEYFQVSDITLFVSEREGLPGVVLQSMSTEIPIITTNIENVTCYMLTDGIEGFITSDDPREISEKMMILLSDSKLRDSMGKNGRKNVLKRFSIIENTNQIEELFRNVINR